MKKFALSALETLAVLATLGVMSACFLQDAHAQISPPYINPANVNFTGGSITGISALGVAGNETFTGTGRRILGDFSSATRSNRVLFQTSTTNGNTVVGAIPNGTSTISKFAVFSGSDPNNAAEMQIEAQNASHVGLNSQANGTGTLQPIDLQMNGSPYLRLFTTGRVYVGATPTDNGTDALQVNGSVTASGQIKSTIVTGTAPFSVASTTQVANLNAATAGTTTNIAGGAGGSIPYQSAANTTALLANGTAGQCLQSQGTTLAPVWGSCGGAPGGANTQIQFNNAGAFGGSASLTWNGTTLTTSSVTFGNTATGGVVGTTTNDTAATGYVGEYVSSNVASGSAVSLTSGVASNITSISLTAGDWDVTGEIGFLAASSTSITLYAGSISTTTASLDFTLGGYFQWPQPATVPGAVIITFPLSTRRISITATTTIYLVSYCNFTVSTQSTFGLIRARRVR